MEVAELGALDGELVAVAALRPGEELDEPPPPPDPEEELALEDDAARRGRCRGGAGGGGAAAPAAPAQGTLDFEGSFRGPLTVAAYAGDDVLVAEAETLAAFALARGDRPVVAHDWKTLAMADEACDAPPLAHDTMVAAYLIDPARRGYPLDELAAEAGLGVEVDGADGVARRAVLTRLVAERQRERLEEDGLTRLLEEIELPLVDVLVEMERAGVKLDVKRLREIGRPLRRARDATSSAGSGTWRARSSRSGRRSSWRRSCSTSSACRRSAAARPASRPTPGCSRRSATSTRSCRRSRSGARSRSSSRPTSTRSPS